MRCPKSHCNGPSLDLQQRLPEFLAILSMLVIASLAWAQTKTGAIYGKIVDAEKNPLPGVTITVSGPILPPLTTITNEEGTYRFPIIPAGTEYVVKAELQGFKTARSSNMLVTAGADTEVNLTLEVGKLEEPINVQAAEGVVESKAGKLYSQIGSLWRKGTEEGLQKSIECLEKVIGRDPGFALAYAMLANAYMALGWNGFSDPAKAYPKAKAYADRALNLDDGLDEAHSASACIKRDYDWDFVTAENGFLRAIQLGPYEANAHLGYGTLLLALGRHEEAIKEVDLATKWARFEYSAGRGQAIRAILGWVLYCAKRYDKAIEGLREVLKSDPDQWATHQYLGYIYSQGGDHLESEKHFKIAMGIEKHPSLGIGLALCYARAGKAKEARGLLSELNERSKKEKEYLSPALLAAVFGALGERDAAFALLEMGFATRDVRMIYLKVDPIYDPLRSDPRFAKMLRKIGLTQH